MTFEKPTLRRLCAAGSSLVFVNGSKSSPNQVYNHLANPHYLKPFIVMPTDDFAKDLNAFAALNEPKVLIAFKTIAHGFRLPVDRVVWVGQVPTGKAYATYIQCMSRGDMPQYLATPGKYHYLESEL